MLRLAPERSRVGALRQLTHAKRAARLANRLELSVLRKIIWVRSLECVRLPAVDNLAAIDRHLPKMKGKAFVAGDPDIRRPVETANPTFGR
jgi:hypothetical protein